MLNKPAHVRMCILDLSKVLMYKFHYDCIKNKHGINSRLLLTGTDSLMYEIKTKYFYENFSKDKEMFDFSNFLSKTNYYYDSNKLVVGNMKDETPAVAIREFVGLKPKMYLYLVDDSSEHNKAKVHSEYKDVFLNNKCLDIL